jgi:3-dehydrosphinganine reductase
MFLGPRPRVQFSNRLALITGGSRGIGLAVAKRLAAAGSRVYILARDSERLEAARIEVVAAGGGRESGIIAVDVADEEAVASALSEFLSDVGTPDLVVNSAGVAHPGLFHELDPSVFHWMMDVNYFGTLNVTRAVVPAMIARGSGHLVNVSSIAGFLGVYGYSAYGASKFAVTGLSDVLRAELKPKGIGVSVVFPPDTATEQLAYESQFKPPVTKALSGSAAGVMQPEEVAAAIVRGVARGRYIITPGSEGRVLYGISHMLGKLVYPVMDWQVSRARKKVGSTEVEGPHRP